MSFAEPSLILASIIPDVSSIEYPWYVPSLFLLWSTNHPEPGLPVPDCVLFIQSEIEKLPVLPKFNEGELGTKTVPEEPSKLNAWPTLPGTKLTPPIDDNAKSEER